MTLFEIACLILLTCILLVLIGIFSGLFWLIETMRNGLRVKMKAKLPENEQPLDEADWWKEV